MKNFKNDQQKIASIMWESFDSADDFDVMIQSEPIEQEVEILDDLDEPEVEDDDNGGIDHEDMILIYSDIKKLAEYSKRMLGICKEGKLEPWMIVKLIKASEYVCDVWHRVDAKADFANDGLDFDEEL